MLAAPVDSPIKFSKGVSTRLVEDFTEFHDELHDKGETAGLHVFKDSLIVPIAAVYAGLKAGFSYDGKHVRRKAVGYDPSAITSRDGFKTPLAPPVSSSMSQNRKPPTKNGNNGRGRRAPQTPYRPQYNDAGSARVPINKGKPGSFQGQIHNMTRTDPRGKSVVYTYRWDGSQWKFQSKFNKGSKSYRQARADFVNTRINPRNDQALSGVDTMYFSYGTGSSLSGMQMKPLKPSTVGGMRFAFKSWLNNLVMTSTGTTLWKVDGTNDCAGQWYYNPINTLYAAASPVANIGKYFDQYRVHKLTLVYSTNYTSGNTVNYQITWCLCNSIDHWEKMGVATAVTTPTKAQIMAMPTADTFNSSVPERTQALMHPTGWLYTASPQGLTGGVNYAAAGAEERTAYACTAGVRIDGATPGANINIADMSLIVDIEFKDMTAATTTGVTMNLERKKNTLNSRMERLEAKLLKAEEKLFPPLEPTLDLKSQVGEDSDDEYKLVRLRATEAFEAAQKPSSGGADFDRLAALGLLPSRPPSTTSKKSSSLK